MQDKLNKLESNQQEQLSRVTPDDFSNWLGASATKALLLQLEIDLEDLKENWVYSKYNKDEEKQARGQANYIVGLMNTIKTLKSDD